MGHEYCGLVEEVGSSVKTLKPGQFLLARASMTLHLHEEYEILSAQKGRARLRETRVTLGEGSDAGPLRLIEWKTPKGHLRLLTNVLDLDKLPADQAILLYEQRWSVERCYLSLKDTLNLNHLFNASPAAVGQQVYATAMLYNALGLSQGEIARKAKVEPERISPEKMFPRLTDKILMLTLAELAAEWQWERDYRALKELNPDLKEPPRVQLEKISVFQLWLDGITLEPRQGRRRERRFCKGRKYATSYARIPGAKKYVRI